MKLRYPLIAGALAAALAYPAFADLNYTQGAGTVLFDFVCFSTKHCPVHVPINSAGTEIMTSSNPAQVTGANGTFPATQSGTWNITNVSGSVSLPTGAATAANQATEISSLSTIATNTGAAIPGGTNTIGNVGADPSSGGATPGFAFLAMPASTTTQIVALSGSTKTYVTSLMVFAGGSGNVTFKYGTGSNCGTGTTTLAGPYPVTAQAGFSQGAGTGAVMIVPAGQALCITTDATIGGGVHLTYQQK